MWAFVGVAALATLAFSASSIYEIEPPLSVTIEPKIYDPNANIGVLNEQAAFKIHVSNHLTSVANMTVNVSAGNSVVQSQEMIVQAGEARDLNFSQQLTTTGIWVVAARANDTGPIRSYSFEVMTNSEEANVAVNQWRTIEDNRNLGYANLLLACGSMGFSVYTLSILKRNSRKKDPSTTEP